MSERISGEKETSGVTSLNCRQKTMRVKVRLCASAAFVFSVCSRRSLWPCLREPAELGFCGDTEGARSASLSGLRISANIRRNKRCWMEFLTFVNGFLTSYESLMRSVMFVCLTAGTSVSLLPGSNAAGGDGDTQDDSSLPIWSRKLQKAKGIHTSV